MSSEAERPVDFTVTYTWHAGSMPPPYHYEYVMRIGPDCGGEIVFHPDYPADGVPCWTETFPLAEERLDELYALILKHGLLSAEWPEAYNEPVGGSQEWLRIKVDGESKLVPNTARLDDGVKAVYAFMRVLTPERIWKDLMLRREEYERNYEHEGT